MILFSGNAFEERTKSRESKMSSCVAFLKLYNDVELNEFGSQSQLM